MADMASDERAIENLIALYAFLVDDGDFAGVGNLFANGELLINDGPPAVGAAAVESLLSLGFRTYANGSPFTRHVTSNLIIELASTRDAASARSYSTTFQAVAGFPLQPIACGRYADRFERREGKWVFARRQITTGLVGDMRNHRR